MRGMTLDYGIKVNLYRLLLLGLPDIGRLRTRLLRGSSTRPAYPERRIPGLRPAFPEQRIAGLRPANHERRIAGLWPA